MLERFITTAACRKPSRAVEEAGGTAPIRAETAGCSSVPDHQGLAQGVRLQLELVDPMLDDVPDAHVPSEPAVLDREEVADARAGHERHDGGDPVARRAG